MASMHRVVATAAAMAAWWFEDACWQACLKYFSVAARGAPFGGQQHKQQELPKHVLVLKRDDTCI
jgi:hypothetical protein